MSLIRESRLAITRLYNTTARSVGFLFTYFYSAKHLHGLRRMSGMKPSVTGQGEFALFTLFFSSCIGKAFDQRGEEPFLSSRGCILEPVVVRYDEIAYGGVGDIYLRATGVREGRKRVLGPQYMECDTPHLQRQSYVTFLDLSIWLASDGTAHQQIMETSISTEKSNDVFC